MLRVHCHCVLIWLWEQDSGDFYYTAPYPFLLSAYQGWLIQRHKTFFSLPVASLVWQWDLLPADFPFPLNTIIHMLKKWAIHWQSIEVWKLVAAFWWPLGCHDMDSCSRLWGLRLHRNLLAEPALPKPTASRSSYGNLLCTLCICLTEWICAASLAWVQLFKKSGQGVIEKHLYFTCN